MPDWDGRRTARVRHIRAASAKLRSVKPHRDRHLNWAEGFRALRAVLPAAEGFAPDELPPLSPDGWSPLAISGRSDVEVARDLWTLVAKPASGPLVVVTFASFAQQLGPFFVQAESLDELIDAHPESTGDSFFSGDVLIVSEGEKSVIVVHHEELVGCYRAS